VVVLGRDGDPPPQFSSKPLETEKRSSMSTHTFRIALAQINPTVGDLSGNVQKVAEYLEKAKGLCADLLVFPELVITGYPPEDLLLKPSFIEDNLKALESLIPSSRGITALVGYVDKKDDIYNAAALLHDGDLVASYHKNYLPNYGVFDENRYFQAGNRSLVFALEGVRVGVSICEDIWQPTGVLPAQVLQGNAEVAVNMSASPFYAGKREGRVRMLSTRARDNTVALAYVNMVGGQDELVFDGSSLVFDADGSLLAQGAAFVEDLVVADLNVSGVFRTRLLDPRRRHEKRLGVPHQDQVTVVSLPPLRDAPQRGARTPFAPSPRGSALSETEEIFHALVLGIRDYFRKNSFKKAVIGLSGGVDSSLTAVLASEALGTENVVGVFMPSQYSSEQSRRDALALAENLGIAFQTIPITDIYSSYLSTLEPLFTGRAQDVTEENLQARIRGNLLMALSNKFGWLVITTGNKSELSVGYCTLYGDTAGGLAALKDVPKTTVYELAHYVNHTKGKEVIPRSVLEKPPSAELRPDQKDTDSLPPYPELDPILKAYVEEDQSLEEIVLLGIPGEQVKRIISMVDRSEYKRRQGPPGIKITPKAFGRDRRLPITNRYGPL